jgi:hypothetical protein
MQTPSCRALLFSWLLGAVGICAMQFLHHLGMFIALLIVPIWQGIRGKHDQEIAEWLFRGSGIAPRLAATYYVLVGIAFLCLVANGERFDDLPLAGGAIIILFPPLVAMAVADHEVCSRRRVSRLG